MRKSEIKVGGLYQAKVNNKIVVVRVDSIREIPGRNPSLGRNRIPDTTAYDVTNTKTGRKTTFRSAAKFRGPAVTKREVIKEAGALTDALIKSADRKLAESDPNPKVNSALTRGDLKAAETEMRNDTLGQRIREVLKNDPNVSDAPSPEVRVDASDLSPSEVTELTRPEATADRLRVEERAARFPSNPQVDSPYGEPTIATPLHPATGLAAKLTAPRPSSTSNGSAPHLIIEARAGTGKTTTLIEGLKKIKNVYSDHPAAKDPMPQQAAIWSAMAKGPAPRFIGFCAFNKSIATELQSRVPAGCDAMTLHSLGFRAISKALPGLKVDSYNVQNIISRLLEKDIRDLRKECPVLLQATEELVGLCKQNLVCPADADFPVQLGRLAAHYGVELASEFGKNYQEEIFALVPRVLEACLDPKNQGAIDFNDMVWLPTVLNLPMFRYDLLLIDEFQDTNRAQQELAKRAGKRLVMCGDPKQAIYGFAGADSKAMTRMEEEMSATPAGCEHLYLTVTRRCGKAIVDEARQIVPDFEAHPSNGAGSVTEAKYPLQGPRGERQEIPFEQTYMATVLEGDFILCRTNAPLVSQCFRFIKRGRKATIQGRDIGQGLISTVQKQKASTVRELIEKLNRWYESEEGKERAKKNPSEAKLLALSDRFECLMCFCSDLSASAPVSDVERKIQAIFTDDKNAPGVRLSSIHRAKGLEANRVFFLQIPEGPCPHPMATSDWEQESENNLLYVGITRAKAELIWVY